MIKNSSIKLPINVNNATVYISEAGENRTLVSRLSPTGDKVEMIIGVDFSELALWHHKNVSLHWDFPQLEEQEIFFLQYGTIYDIHDKKHKMFDAYETNYYH